MKTIVGALLAVGLMSTSASAWYCPPGYGYGHSQSYSQHRPSYGHVQKRVIEKVAPVAPHAQPADPAPAPAPEPVPQK